MESQNMLLDNNITEKNIDLESAKRFFCEAVRLAQACGNKISGDSLFTKVPVAKGECLKTLLCDEYDGIKLYKFTAKKGTKLSFSPDGVCRGFIIHEGDMLVLHGNKEMRLPKERHFFYMSGAEEVSLTFFDDTWFYMVSIPA